MPRISEQALDRARDLRGTMTDAERKLWYEFLRPCAHKFYKQKPFGPFFLDFYCHEARLVIELDGGQHYTDRGIAQDRSRTQYLENHGLQVLRFSDHDVLSQFDAVCQVIQTELERKISR